MVTQIYVVYRILFFVPFGSDDLWNWQNIAKIIYFSDVIPYPALEDTVIYNTVNGIGISTIIDNDRSYPITIILIFNFIHKMSFNFNFLGTKSLYLLIEITTVLTVYDLLTKLKYKKSIILVSLIIMISTPYFFIFATSGYIDGILGSFLLFSIYVTYLSKNNKNYSWFLFPTYSIYLLTKIEGLYIFYVILIIIIVKYHKLTKEYLISILFLILYYLSWIFFVKRNTGTFIKLYTGGAVSEMEESVFGFIINLPNINNFFYMFKFPLHYPFLLLFFILSTFILFKGSAKNSRINILLFIIIFTYIIPWAYIANPGSGPRPLAHVIPIITIYATIGVKYFLDKFSVNKLYSETSRKPIFIKLLPKTMITVFWTINIILILTAPLFINTQFSNLMIVDDYMVLENSYNNQSYYNNVLHGTQGASFLIGEWINDYVPAGSRILLQKVEGGTHLLINKQSVMVEPLNNLTDLKQFIDFIERNKITHIVYDSIYQYSSMFSYILASGYFRLLKSIKYNVSIGIYQNENIYTAVYEFNPSISIENVVNISSNIPLPQPDAVNEYSINFKFFRSQNDSNIKIINPFDTSEKLYGSFDSLILSINNITILSGIYDFPISINSEYFKYGINEIKITIFNLSSIYLFPKIIFV